MGLNPFSCYSHSTSQRKKCPNKEFFLVRIQFECGKIQTRKNSVFGHFSRSASNIEPSVTENDSGCFSTKALITSSFNPFMTEAVI